MILCLIISLILITSCACYKQKSMPPKQPMPEAPKFVSPQPVIVSMDAITFVGMEKRFTFNTIAEIPMLWMDFMPLEEAIQNKVKPIEAWGVSYDMDYSVQPGEFTYFVGMEVSNTDNIPTGMIAHVTPASKYAKFTHYGSLDNLSGTYTYIYNVWLPQSGYDMGMGNELELYNEKFNPEGEDSEIFIFIPLQ